MPININKELPAYSKLIEENIFVITEDRAARQDIRPMNILILNLMPQKIVAETQLLRLLSNTPLQLNIEFLRVLRDTKHTSKDHLESFYRTFEEIRTRKFDGLIVTGAPVENLRFEDVSYWSELCRIFDWAEHHVYSTLYICWGAMAALYHFYGVPKHRTTRKVSGVYRHHLENPGYSLTRGFDDYFHAIHSRHAEVRREDIENNPRASDQLVLLSYSPEGGLYLLQNNNGRKVFVTGHAEYEIGTLGQEYLRDQDRSLNPDIPYNYFPENDTEKMPQMNWRAHGTLLFVNWINYHVYQETPYRLEDIH
ncbi:homoserine O-succinyltransferase [Candidatus Haliotispira prima]|uniref:Homoserine O-acetyltransferase n=1 Tax=Candidatus Haliotispira prima TaxID=3034016 RepID=A0ABY8MK97_9SPIO|nr:homoserine O-succinyltransferase [Candidatus Haliotispira prima]